VRLLKTTEKGNEGLSEETIDLRYKEAGFHKWQKHSEIIV
jgi:hypothetical protein